MFGTKTLIDALSTAILFGADDHEHADTLLRQLPTLADQSRDRRDRVQAWIGRLYPPPPDDGDSPWGSLQPDRLAERVVGLRLHEHPRLPDPLLSAATAVQRTRLITVYTRAAAQPAFHRTLDKPLTDLILRHPALLAGPAIDVTTQVEVPGPLVGALRQLTSDPQTGIDDLTAMSRRLPKASHNLAEWAAELNQRLVDEYRNRVTTDPAAFLPDLAMSLNNLSVELDALGRREECLAAIEEAVQVYWELAAVRSDAFLPDLATSLSNLSSGLGELGRLEKGLAAIEEAVTIRRELAAARPDAFVSDLAASLINLSTRLGALGQREEGLAAIEEAVQIYRQLTAARPDAFLPDLAMSLNNLSMRQGALGKREQGLAAIEETVTIRRELAAAHPDAFLPAFAASLDNLSNRLGELGRRDECLAAVEEAVLAYRQMAARWPDIYQPDLDRSMAVLAWLKNLGGEG
ncbi:hypothetical protein DMB66_18475 [Actinoplanes sp. ATCC 53533]|uniref:tetratricopeptide repeat protein n=1 Tax=Actinoplanes sp. ATCC 53533 TaxID=1288362 RepID=UPI000F76B0DF|nr:tetratricopeptide repeat protein [Actinoplanes sp. ATCC 53533]RSM64900.1 hypothetical protein DMB66_18475 [Actinoplanes sp. ATCC 53533]